jgi:hypothetical protein
MENHNRKVIALYEHSLDGVLDVIEVNKSGYAPITGLCKIVVYKKGLNGWGHATYTNIEHKQIIFI